MANIMTLFVPVYFTLPIKCRVFRKIRREKSEWITFYLNLGKIAHLHLSEI